MRASTVLASLATAGFKCMKTKWAGTMIHKNNPLKRCNFQVSAWAVGPICRTPLYTSVTAVASANSQ